MDNELLDIPVETGNETESLLKLLKNLELDLEQPYIERRIKAVTQKSNVLDELKDTINELNQREKDLQACIGISKMLISNNNSLLQENRNLKLEIINLQNHSKHLKDEISRLGESLETSEEKYKEVNNTLIKTETELIKLSVDLKKTQNSENFEELHRKISIDRYESEVAELSYKFQIEQESLLNTKIETDKKLKSLSSALIDYQNTVSLLEKTNEETVKKLRKTEKNLKKNQEALETETLARSELESLYDQLYEKHTKLLAFTEKQSEEIEILQSPLISAKIEISAEGDSLKQELEDLQEDPQEAFEALLKKSISLPTSKRNSLKFHPRSFGIFFEVSILIKSKKPRKSPCEEYFILATQAIKLNSPYIDNICTISPTALYEDAVKSQVPFQKWHTWIETQLNSAYLQGIYQKI